jgi:hypothetical protein
MQMFQFFLNLCQATYLLSDAHSGSANPYPKFVCQILFYYMISLLGRAVQVVSIKTLVS